MATLSEVQRWRREEAAVFEGWDFSYLKDRASQDEPPWSYRDVAANLIPAARHPLDVDTGGGEFLVSLAPLPLCLLQRISRELVLWQKQEGAVS